ncbi:hypothetical protein LWT67_23535, partial [Enterobacter hormaechei]|nr:hypothetical protein [Enterobacter hormaechei]
LFWKRSQNEFPTESEALINVTVEYESNGSIPLLETLAKRVSYSIRSFDQRYCGIRIQWLHSSSGNARKTLSQQQQTL